MDILDLTAYCGLMCQGCPINWLTLTSDPAVQEKLKAVIVRVSKEHYQMELKPEDIMPCDGCRTETGRLFSACAACEIRACARQRKLKSCAQCADYACEKLNKLFVADPNAKDRMEVIRGII